MNAYPKKRSAHPGRAGRLVAAAVFFFIIFVFLRKPLFDAAGIAFGAAVVAFLVSPLAEFFERRLNRHSAALCALLSILFAALAALSLLVPALAGEAAELIETLPRSIMQMRIQLSSALQRLETCFPGLSMSELSWSKDRFPSIAQKTAIIAGGIADSAYRFSLMIVLGYFFICDRERVLIRLELLVPRRFRQTAVQIGVAVCSELRNYLKGQGLISLIVGLLSACGLALVGVRSALVLGAAVGIFNLIPYFGPVLGAVPAVLMALSDGWIAALLAAAVLWLVQQADSTLISPRIMSSVSGVSPAVVLLAVFIGSGLGGIVGMLLAMPAVMAFRTVFRVFVQRHENV